MSERLSHRETLASLAPIWPVDMRPAIQAAAAICGRKLIVLDDDPTGTQTVHDLPVLTAWDVDALQKELMNEYPCFYILTNSRSLPEIEAVQLNRQIIRNLLEASKSVSRGFVIVSRSDSTLRGHFPAETDALSELLDPVDATILIPYFEAGGRVTIDDVHYVIEGDSLVPAAETQFARDAAFGYQNSNLCDWIEEKTHRRILASSVHSISLNELRMTDSLNDPTRPLALKLHGLPRGSVCVVNACHPRDLEFFALASLAAEQAGARFIYRTAASFVSARLGLESKPLLAGAELLDENVYRDRLDPSAARQQNQKNASGGLIVVGSHVPKTTEQLSRLVASAPISAIELSVPLLMNNSNTEKLIREVVERLESALRLGRDVALYSSRTLAVGADATESLAISARVSAALSDIIGRLSCRPRFLLAKGGITSSDIATKALVVRRSDAVGLYK